MLARNTYRCRGYTLLELLIVVSIMIILIAIALPTAKYAMEESKLRESSRVLNAYFATAKTRAAATGRPVGVAFQVDSVLGSSNTYQVTQMYLAEVSAPYGGSTIGARARVESSGYLGFPDSSTDTSERSILNTLIQQGEYFMIRFDYKGDWFQCLRDGTGFKCGNSISGNAYPPSAMGAMGYPFQILRAPRRVGQPVELTNGTCIDIAYCGSGPSGYEFNGDPTSSGTNVYATTPSFVLMFNPSGSLAGYYMGTHSPYAASGTAHFLIGRVEKVGATGGNSNLADPAALWVSVGRLTGSITSAENLPVLPLTGMLMTDLQNCRQVATSREQMGAK